MYNALVAFLVAKAMNEAYIFRMRKNAAIIDGAWKCVI